ncbi:MAG: hypothetical protein WDO73_13360 [Ignavibacteriota bacterium]
MIGLTTSGFTVLSANYAAATAPPSIGSVQNAANGSTSVAPGGFISVYGAQLSATNIATSQIPLPTALGESCLVVNGSPIPLLFVSTGQVNAQLPLNMGGNVSMSVHTPAGVSNNFNFVVNSAAPAVFLSGIAGPQTGLLPRRQRPTRHPDQPAARRRHGHHLSHGHGPDVPHGAGRIADTSDAVDLGDTSALADVGEQQSLHRLCRTGARLPFGPLPD